MSAANLALEGGYVSSTVRNGRRRAGAYFCAMASWPFDRVKSARRLGEKLGLKLGRAVAPRARARATKVYFMSGRKWAIYALRRGGGGRHQVTRRDEVERTVGDRGSQKENCGRAAEKPNEETKTRPDPLIYAEESGRLRVLRCRRGA